MLGLAYYFSYDGQGNVVQVSNKAGELPYSLYAYDSYGAETEGEGDPTLSSYKGYDRGPFGYKTGVRQYDPETGRFLSPDPFKGYMTDPASQHPYMYCRGNPISYSDPSGYDDIYIGWYKGKGPKEEAFKDIKTRLEKLGHKVRIVSSPSAKDVAEAISKFDLVFLSIHGSEIKNSGIGIAGDQKNGVRFMPSDLKNELKDKKMRAKVVAFLGCYTKNLGWEEVLGGRLPPIFIGAVGDFLNATTPAFVNNYLVNYYGKAKKLPSRAFRLTPKVGRLKISP